jgi:hypothetical protein
MADPRTFVLIGNFTDNITPALEKINNSISKLKANLGDLSNVTKPLKNDFKDLATLSKDFNTSLKSQSGELRDITTALRAYRAEMGRVNRAIKAGGGRRLPNIPAAPVPPGPGGGRSGAPRTGRVPSQRAIAAGAGGAVAGNQLANMMTGAIVKGFQIGTSIMMKPFQYGANAFGERIRDEMTDIQSAGGLFATDLRKNLGMFKNFQEARTAQEAINYRLAKSAAALPGSTAEYVQEAKKVTDTMINAMGKQPEMFVKFGEELGAKTGDKMDALGTVIQKFTEKAVLLGKGSGGQSRMYGMPQLLEMLVNAPNVNIQGMQKYSVLRGNPMLQAALMDAEDEIAKTGAGTAARLRKIMEVLDAALPNEVVQGMKNSMDGIIEVMKSSFLDPEVGLFGLGRKMAKIGPAVDQFGRYIDKNGKVVDSLSKAAEADLSLFAIIRDILGGFALPLSELAQILPELFDPLRKVAEGLIRFRSMAQRFYANFNQYTAEFEALAKEIGGKKGSMIKRTAGARGALLSIANLLRGIGAIDMTKYGDVSKQLQKADANLGAITGDLFKTLMSSDFMKTVGEAIGSFFGNIIKTVGDLMAGATDFANAGPFAKGLKKGWEAAKGSVGVSKIFSSLFKIIGNVLMAAFKAAPFETSLLAALTVGMPLLSGVITTGITTLFEKMLAGGAAGGIPGAGAGAGLLRLAGPIAAVVGALVLFEGGLENATRQLGEGLGSSANSLGGFFDSLGVVIGRVTGQSHDLSGSFDLIGAALLPLTATLDLLEMTARLIIEAWDNLVVNFYRFGSWLASQSWFKGAYSEEDRKRLATGEKQARERLAASAEARNAARRRDDIYYTSLRYGGADKYGSAVQRDIQSKQAKLGGLAPGSEAYKKVNNELYALKKTLAQIPGSGATPTPAGRGAGAAGTTPVSIPTNSPAAAAITSTAAQTTQLNAKATQQIQKTTTANSLLTNIKAASMAMSSKLDGMKSALISISNKMDTITTTLTSGALKVQFSINGGAGGKGGPGMVDTFNPIASQYGLQITSGYRPGDPGYHGADRARDYSNGTGPTPQMMQFAQFMASRFGGSLAELIYTPLGFSIKNGQVVPPYAQAAHYNHVHVAYALGAGMPAFFNSQSAAIGWERSMVPGSVKVGSVTGNSAEGFGGGPITVNNNITISQQSGQDADELASLVALKIGEAVADARAASIYV